MGLLYGGGGEGIDWSIDIAGQDSGSGSGSESGLGAW